jgi:lysophospholipase L1-like esterase
MTRQSRFRNVIAIAAVVMSALVPSASQIFAQARAGATAVAAGAPAGQEMRFAEQIKLMLDEDRSSPPPQNGILFIGSSIFRQWANLKEHMAPLPAFNRAFGGSRTWEVLHYMDQIVLPYRPRIILYYTGSNDVNAGQSAKAIVERTMEFMTRAHAALPATRIYYVAINRSPDKRDKWDVVDAVNAQMKAAAASTPYLEYIDLNPVLFTRGEPRMELYRPDGLHFHPPAYDEFTGIIKPVLTQAWREVAN